MLHHLLPTIKGIPVLMYHRIWPGMQDGLTLTPEQLREQWTWLKKEGYQALSLEDFLLIVQGKKKRSGKQVLLTFDDGYQNNLTYVYPLAEEMGFCFTIFIITATLDGFSYEEQEPWNKKLRVSELKQMAPATVQLALHGYKHENFSETSLEDIKQAMNLSLIAFGKSGLPYHKVLAYPYGARPKDAKALSALKDWMKESSIEAAFRIGNKPEAVPGKDIYEIKRIDIRGEDTIDTFRIKLKKGKLKPF